MRNLYSIYDSFIDEFLPPFVAKNDKMAELSYDQYLASHPLHKDQVAKLYSIGTFDENKGLLGLFSICKCIKTYNSEVNNGSDVQ